MNIELATNDRGDLLIVSDEVFVPDISSVEYYKDQRLFMLLYNDADSEGDLLHYEVPYDVTKLITLDIEHIFIIVPDDSEQKVSFYRVPLVQI